MPKYKALITQDLQSQIGKNIQSNRNRLGLSQAELARLIMDELKANGKLSNLAISTYERGDRCPPLATLIAIANIFNITLNDLVGCPTRNKKEYVIKEGDNSQHGEFIRPENYALYDQKPVWIETKTGDEEGCWGILDYRRHDDNVYVVCTKGVVKITPSIVLYEFGVVDAICVSDKNMKKLNVGDLLTHEIIYCISTSHDEYTKALFTGYYKCDRQHMVLINRQNGLPLPVTGLGFAYQAFATDDM